MIMVRVLRRTDLKREEVEDISFEGVISDRIRIEHIIADQDATIEKGHAKSLKIKPIVIPAGYILLNTLYATNPYGHVIAVGEETLKRLNEDRNVDYAMFLAGIEADIRKNDLIGMVMLVEVLL